MHPLTAAMVLLSLFSFLRCKPAAGQSANKESDEARQAAYTAHSEALYPVRIKGQWGYMNRKAEVVLAPEWDTATDFEEGFACVSRDGRYGFIDHSGNVRIPLQYDRETTFSDGLAAVSREGRFGYIDSTGREVIPCRYEAAGSFHEGRAGVKIDGWTAIIETSGQLLEAPKLTISVDAIRYVNGLTRGFGADEQTGFLDTAGAWAIEPRFHSAGRFNEGLAWAMLRKDDPAAEHGYTIRGGFIDTGGQFVIEPQYDFGWDFTEGHAVVWSRSEDKQEKIWSLIDRTGKTVLGDLRYRNMGALHEGLIAVQDDNMKWGFMNLAGEIAIPITYTGVGLFRDGLARMETGDALAARLVYINPAGQVVWSE